MIIPACAARAQRPVKLRTMWDRPQVCVVFQGYKLYFTIHDIDKALLLLSETGDSTFGTSSGLDTAGSYVTELHPGVKMEYTNALQKLMQKGVGAFLLSSGHVLIHNPRGKKLNEILMDIQPIGDMDENAYMLFYDPRNRNLLFTGKMAVAMYKKDLGID
jgi:hypothetical protein